MRNKRDTNQRANLLCKEHVRHRQFGVTSWLEAIGGHHRHIVAECQSQPAKLNEVVRKTIRVTCARM